MYKLISLLVICFILINLSSCASFNEAYKQLTDYAHQRREAQNPYIDGKRSKATFNSPVSIAIDSNDIVYVTEFRRGTVRVIAKDGSVSTLKQTIRRESSYLKKGTDKCFYRPTGIAINLNNNIYISHSAYSIICKISTQGQVSIFSGLDNRGHKDGNPSIATLYNPHGISIDKNSNLYIVDKKVRTIRKITKKGVVSTIAGVKGKSSHFDGPVSVASFSMPNRTAVDVAGNVFVTDYRDHSIRKVGHNGMVTTVAGTPNVKGYLDGVAEQAQFNKPTGIAIDKNNNIYVSDSHNHVIRKITPEGMVTTLAGTGEKYGYQDGIGVNALFMYPSAIALDSFDNIFVVDTGNQVIRKITPTGIVSTYSGLPRHLNGERK